MKTLKQHEAEQRAKWDSWAESQKDANRKPCGIECPECKAELRMDTTMTYASNPPKQRVFCEACGWSGTVLA